MPYRVDQYKPQILWLPGNPRYQPKALEKHFGYDNLYRGVAEVEVANLLTLAEVGLIGEEEINLLTPEVFQTLLDIPTTAVDEVEKSLTHHDIRAFVLIGRQILDPRLARWLHLLLTSYDALDTGRILQFSRAYQHTLKPKIKEVCSLMAELVPKFAYQRQIGRTHGQAALPITVGFWLATILHRILYNAEKMEEFSQQLVGKISGAVGAYNAQVGLGVDSLCKDKPYEVRVLEKIGLKPARISTQILPPEPLTYFLFACTMLSAALAQFGRDARQLMRTEIAEFSEPFGSTQVGSSTMAQKRNPINFEGLEGHYLRTKNELGKVLDTLISEHQRDLVGSCVSRDFPVILVNLLIQLNTLTKEDQKTKEPFLRRVQVNPEACRLNLERVAPTVLAEPLYIALQMAGYQGDAHELINHHLVPTAERRGQLLVDVLEEYLKGSSDEELHTAFNNIPQEVKELLRQPQNYLGEAPKKALEIAAWAEERVARY